MLTEIKTTRVHYFVDENDLLQGEYKRYWSNGQLWVHSFYLNGNLHGEYKDYHLNGLLWEHSFYQNSNQHGEYYVYDDNGELGFATFYYQGTDLDVDPSTLTERDKTYILLSGRLPLRE